MYKGFLRSRFLYDLEPLGRESAHENIQDSAGQGRGRNRHLPFGLRPLGIDLVIQQDLIGSVRLQISNDKVGGIRLSRVPH